MPDKPENEKPEDEKDDVDRVQQLADEQYYERVWGDDSVGHGRVVIDPNYKPPTEPDEK